MEDNEVNIIEAYDSDTTDSDFPGIQSIKFNKYVYNYPKIRFAKQREIQQYGCVDVDPAILQDLKKSNVIFANHVILSSLKQVKNVVVATEDYLYYVLAMKSG